MDELVDALRSVHLEETEAGEVAERLVKGKFTTVARLQFADKEALRDCGITAPFEIQAVLALASKAKDGMASTITHAPRPPETREIRYDIIRQFEAGKKDGDVVMILDAIDNAIDSDHPTDFLSKLAEVGVMLSRVGKVLIDDFDKKSSDVTWRRCGAIAVLALNDSNKPELGRLGACKAVVDALNTFGVNDNKVASYGCCAVGNLARNTDRTELVRLGACKAVVDALNAFGMKESEVAQFGCFAVRELAINYFNITELGRLGACKAVVDALNAFGTKESEVAKWGCSAVGNLAANNDSNSTELVRVGACKAVVDALNAFGTKESGFASRGCHAVGNLASNNDSNRTEFGRLGACKAVVDSLDAFGTRESEVAQLGCFAVGKLADNNASNKSTLKSLGALEAVRNCLENSYKNHAERNLTS